jgi:hypothetical protein
VPTKHRRISVTSDDVLTDAVARAARHFPGAGEATIVHALAIKGAELLEREQKERQAALERLVAWSTDPDSSMDRALLIDIDAHAWRTPSQ